MRSIRPELARDRTEIHQVIAAAFERPEEARLVDALRDDPSFHPELSLVYEEDGRIAGHILFTEAPIVGAQSTWPALALAPVSVSPEHQNRGVGSALVRQGVREATRLGHRIVVVLGHPSYYPRFGFTSARAVGIAAPFPVDDEAFLALGLTPGALTGISGIIQYAPAFAAV